MAEVGTEEILGLCQVSHQVCFLFVSPYAVGPPQWNLSLTECLALVAWDK